MLPQLLLLIRRYFCQITLRDSASHSTHHWHLTGTRETAARPRTFTYDVFDKYHGPWTIRLQIVCPVSLLAIDMTISMFLACLSRTLTSWMCPELTCIDGYKPWLVECVNICLAQVVTGACRQGHIKPVLKELTECLFELEPASRSRHSSTKSEQIIIHDILRTSSTTADQRLDFIPHPWLSLRNRLEEFDWLPLLFITLLSRH